MRFWSEAPFIRLLLPFLSGILLAIYSSINLSNLYWVIIFLLFLFLILNSIKKIQVNYNIRWANGLFINTILFLLGVQLTISKTQHFHPDHFSRLINTDSSFAVIQLLEPPITKSNSLKFEAEIKKIITSNKSIECTGKAIIYLKMNPEASQLHYGDLLFIKNKFNQISPPQNPGEFNYQRYLSFHQIQHQSYLKPKEWKSLHKNAGNPVLQLTYRWRDYFFKILKNYLTTDHELAVASALILGYKDLIDDQIVHAYSNTGAMHVLAVSGLHVGIVYWVLNMLLLPLKQRRILIAIKVFLLLIFVWGFALITGSSPSVIRAAAMLSFIIIGQGINRTLNIYNTLACSAFFILSINPFLIMEVGFQLSYLAVIGIVSLQPKIYNLFFIKNYLIDKVWAITAVSVAAQIATFPLGLLYFHQFPIYFLISNLVVIPAATFVLYAGILLFITSPISLIATYIGKSLYAIVLGMNKLIFMIEKFPFSLVQGISIDIMQTWLIYFFIVTLIVFLLVKQKNYLISALITGVIFLSKNLKKELEQVYQKKIIVYHIPQISAIEFVDGKNNFFITDSSLIDDENKMLFHVKHNWWDIGIRKTQIITYDELFSHNIESPSLLSIQQNYFQFYNKKVILVDGKTQLKKSNYKLKIDFIILTKNPSIKMVDLSECFDFQQIIFDSSCSEWKMNKWKQECEKMNLNYYSVKEKGAFLINI